MAGDINVTLPISKDSSVCSQWFGFAQTQIQAKAAAWRSRIASKYVTPCVTRAVGGAKAEELGEGHRNSMSMVRKQQSQPSCKGTCTAGCDDDCFPREYRKNYESISEWLSKPLASRITNKSEKNMHSEFTNSAERAGTLMMDSTLGELVGLPPHPSSATCNPPQDGKLGCRGCPNDGNQCSTTLIHKQSSITQEQNWVKWEVHGTGQFSKCVALVQVAGYSCPGKRFESRDILCNAFPWKSDSVTHDGDSGRARKRGFKYTGAHSPWPPVSLIDKECNAERCAEERCPAGRIMSQFGVDLAPQSVNHPECVDWFFKADAALRIKNGYIRHAAQIKALQVCVAWFATGKPEYTEGTCAKTKNPWDRRNENQVHRRRSGRAPRDGTQAGCENVKAHQLQ